MFKIEMVVRKPTSDEYFRRFYEVFSDRGNCSYKEAWEHLEEEYHSVYNEYKYSSYESFKANKWKYVKRLQAKGNISVTKKRA